MVRERGLEPLCLAAVDFEPTTSTDSVTLAAGLSLSAKWLAGKATSSDQAPYAPRSGTWADRTLPADALRAIRGNIRAALGIEAGILHATVPACQRFGIILRRHGLTFPRRHAAQGRVGRSGGVIRQFAFIGRVSLLDSHILRKGLKWDFLLC